MTRVRLIPFVLGSVIVCAQSFLPDQIPLTNQHANRDFEEGRYEEALKSYLNLYGRDTSNGAVAYNIANTYLAMGDLNKAKQYYDRAVNSNHSEAQRRARFNRGYLDIQNHDLQSAVENYVDYLRKEPDDLDAKRNLELALRQLQEQQEQQQQQQSESDPQQSDQQPQDAQQGASDKQQGDQQQSQDSQGSDSEGQDSQQQEPSDPSQQQGDRDPQDDQGSNPDQQQPDQGQMDPKQQQSQDQEGESPYSETMKQQILQAIQDQEAQQQKELQKRKLGRVTKRAKDW